MPAVRPGMRLTPARVNALRNSENISIVPLPAGQPAITSATFVNLLTSGGSFSFTKLLSETALEVDLSVTCFATVANTTPRFGIQIAGLDFEISGQLMNTIDHETHGGTRTIYGIPAGIYTVTLRWRRAGGTGNLTIDNSDTASCTVTECA